MKGLRSERSHTIKGSRECMGASKQKQLKRLLVHKLWVKRDLKYWMSLACRWEADKRERILRPSSFGEKTAKTTNLVNQQRRQAIIPRVTRESPSVTVRVVRKENKCQKINSN